MGDVIKFNDGEEITDVEFFDGLPEQQQQIIAATNSALIDIAYQALLSVTPMASTKGFEFFFAERTSALLSLECLADEIELFFGNEEDEQP